VAFTLTRGVTLIQGAGQASQPALSQPSLPQPSSPQLAASDSPATSAAVPGASSGANVRIAEQKSAPIRLAALDGKTDYFPGLKPRDTTFQAVRPTDNPDLIWDPASHDVIAWGDVIAYGVGLADLSSVIDRTAAIRALKSMSTQSPQAMRVSPDDRLHRDRQTVDIDLSEVQGRAVVLFNVSADGTVQMLYPKGLDAPSVQTANLRIPLRVREPFGAEQVVAVTSQQRMIDLERILQQSNGRRAPGLVTRNFAQYLPPDARIGSIGFFSVP
jgi:hypothetical protein